MDDLVKVQVIHAAGNPGRPVHQQPRGDFPPRAQHFVELPVRAVLHDDAVARGLRANSPGRGNTRMVRIRTAKVPERLSKARVTY